MTLSPADPSAIPHDVALPLHDKTLKWLQVLWEFQQAMTARSKWMESSMGVTGPQRLVLRLIADHAPVSASALAATLRLHISTVSGILQRLDEAEMIEREADPRDRRRVLIQLAPRGAQILKNKDGTVEAAIQRALQSLDPADVEATGRVIAALTKQLQDKNVESKPGSRMPKPE